jgi:hypothetical protein
VAQDNVNNNVMSDITRHTTSFQCRRANISSKWLNHAINVLSFTFSIKINIVVQWYQTFVCFKRMRNPKRLFYGRYTAALPSLILRPIFVMQKMNRSSASIQNQHD